MRIQLATIRLFALATLLTGSIAVGTAGAAVTVSPLFSDHMVIQRDKPVQVYGTAASGETVVVSFNGQSKTNTADAQGNWTVTLAPMASTTNSQTMSIVGLTTVTINDVVIGDVWLCSGQSNMAFGLNGCNRPGDIAGANFPGIRHFAVPYTFYQEQPLKTLPSGNWSVCNSANAGAFSAVGFYYARKIYQDQSSNIPIGLITTSVGGTCIDPWLAPEGAVDIPVLQPLYSQAIAPWGPFVLFNGMVYPLAPYGVKGMIWFQGENRETTSQSTDSYYLKEKALQQGWKRLWGMDDFACYVVQLEGYLALPSSPTPDGNGSWADTREMQEMVLGLPHGGVGSSLDVGEVNDIHPKDKLDVGERLALWALKNDYNRTNLVTSGPVLRTTAVSNNTVICSFDYVGSGLMMGWKSTNYLPTAEIVTGRMERFSIAGADGVWYAATATIAGATVVVSSPSVAAPRKVAYAYWINPEGTNLYNREGLPASPFRVDDVTSRYTVVASAGTGGSISPAGTNYYLPRRTVLFSVTTNSGYYILDVKVDGVSVGAVRTYTFDPLYANHTIAVTFTNAPPTYTVTATSTGGGTMSPTGALSVVQGGSRSFTITGDTGNTVAVTIDGTLIGQRSTYTFGDVRENHSISVAFKVSLAASAGFGGTITPFGTRQVNYGTTQAFTIAAISNYAIASVVVDGVNVGAVSNYTFTNVMSAHTIAVSFTGGSGSGGSIPQTNQLIFAALASSFPSNGAISTWPAYYPSGSNLVPIATPTAEMIDGRKYSLNTYIDGDGFSYGSKSSSIPCDGATVVVVARPIRNGFNSGWISLVDVFYDELVLGIRDDTGIVCVRRKGSVDSNAIAIPDGQITILTLTVQSNGTYTVHANGIQVMTNATVNALTSLVPGTPGAYDSYITVGRNWPDGWTVFNGNIGDVFLYKTALSTPERQQLEQYITYSLTGGAPLPLVDITNANATVANGVTSYVLGGTNSSYTVGRIVWTNSLGGNGGFAASPGPTCTGWAFAVSLAVGSNVVTVTGTNSVGSASQDAVVIYRQAPPAAFVDITNLTGATTVDVSVTSYTLKGTNNTYTAGTIVWTNSLGGNEAVPASSTGWTFTASVSPGNNVITVNGTNTSGALCQDSVTITVIAPQPHVDITNLTGSVAVPPSVTTWTVKGTNNIYTVGRINWTNALGGVGSVPASATGWAFIVSLATGDNVIAASGTNVMGNAQQDVVTVGVVQVSITNRAASGIGPNGATANGWMNNSSALVTNIVRVYYGTNNGGQVAANWETNKLVGTAVANGAFSTGLAGLQQTTTYYYTFLTTNDVNGMWATNVQSFTTTQGVVIGGRNIPRTNDLLFSAMTTSFPSNGYQGNWATYWPVTNLAAMATPRVEPIAGMKWTMIQRSEGDGYRQGFYPNATNASGTVILPCNGISAFAAIVPTRNTQADGWNSVIDVMYDRVILGVYNNAGIIRVVRQGSAVNSSYAIPDRQMTILSLVVQANGQFKVWMNGSNVMNETTTTALLTNLYPSGATPPDYMKYINVGRNNPDGWTVFNGDIGDVFFYTNALSDAERTQLEGDMYTNFFCYPRSVCRTPTGLMPTTATLNGELLNAGFGGLPEAYVCYGTVNGGTASTASWQNVALVGSGIATGMFSKGLSGLSAGTMYYYTFYSVNSIGAGWSDYVSTFSTVNVPALSNEAPYSVRVSTARARGNLNATNFAPTTVILYHGSSDGGTTPANWQYARNLGVLTVGRIDSILTNITGTCYYRYYATNAAGETWTSSTVSFTPTDTPFDGAANGYGRTITITFNGYSGSSLLADYPALIKLNSSAISGFSYSQFLSGSNDLRFAAADGSLLSHEIDTWNTTSDSFVWVRVPVLQTGTQIRMFYGKSGDTAPTDATNTWEDGFAGVWHLATNMSKNATGYTAYDTNYKNGTQTNVVAIVGVGQWLNQSANSYMQVGDVDLPNTFTVSYWGWRDSQGTTGDQWNLRKGSPFSGGSYGLWNQYGNWRCWVIGWMDSSGGDPCNNTAWTSTDQVWQYVASSFEGTRLRLYGNGVEQSSIPKVVDVPQTGDQLLFGENFNGMLDEVRCEKVTRSADWILATYRNITGTHSFATYSASAAAPFVDLTNAFTIVPNATASATLGGTNNAAVVGSMRYVSVANGTTNDSGTRAAAASWTITVSNLVAGATNWVVVTGTNIIGTPSTDIVGIFRQAAGGGPSQSDVDQFQIGHPAGQAGYGQMSLAWSNGTITVLACTNRSYMTNTAYWFVLTNGVSSPWTHADASNYPSVYYRIISGTFTSWYDVGKYDISVPAGSIAWLSFPFSVQLGCDVLSEWFGQQLEARDYGSFNFPSLQKQDSPGGTIQNSDYYVNAGVTNWVPNSAVAANAGYLLFLPANHGAVKVTGIGMVQTNNLAMQVPYSSVAWLGIAYDVTIDMRQSGLTNILQPPWQYSTFNYDFVDSQQTIGGPVSYAEYYHDNWGSGSVDFFPSAPNADKLEPGKGYLLFFSTGRTGTGAWTCTKPY